MSVQCVFAAQRVGLLVGAAGYVATVDVNLLGVFERTAQDVVLGGLGWGVLCVCSVGVFVRMTV